MPTMRINLDRRSEDMVAIRLIRPVPLATMTALREQDAPILLAPPPMTFGRAEWSVLVTSGLIHALGLPGGWWDWDTVTAFRAPEVTEQDHLLIVASLFLQGHEFGLDQYLPDRISAGAARLSRHAAEYRERESIQTPMAPWPQVVAPLLEHAVDKTHIETLMDLAKHGEEATFKDLAQTLGVPAEKLDELWTGTVRRVKP